MARAIDRGRGGLRVGLCLALVTFMGLGCSSFRREWKAAALRPASHPLAGRWEGQWRSDANGHRGRLRCLIEETGAGGYTARFHANYARVFNFGYTLALEVEPAEVGYRLRGTADLGRLAGGRYTYEGVASATNFVCAYRCARDHGVFEMARPE